MDNMEIDNPERRRFLRSVPVAAAAGLAVMDSSLFSARAGAQMGGMREGSPFEVVSREQIDDDIKATQADSSTKTVYQCKTFSMVITSEGAKTAPEFEWHEGRDHIIEILEGATTYELGGTPQNAHSPKPGEWLAPSSEGATSVDMKKGDIVFIRRGTPHKRITKESVTYSLIAPMGA